MTPDELRAAIKQRLKEQGTVRPGEYLADVDLAEALGADIEDVRQQLDILNAQEKEVRVEKARYQGAYHAVWNR
jgi:hypothetical protein